jgi:4-amino-4-deoxy-L-arabinose transferase-like glycosyltransferase
VISLTALLSGLRHQTAARVGVSADAPAPGAAGQAITTCPRPPTPDPRPLAPRALLALALLCAVLFALRLNAPFLHDDGEARFATVVREMAQTGDWWAPRFQGRPVRKPPLVFWLMGASRAVFGDSEAAARMPSLLAGVAAVLLSASLGARLFGTSVGLLAGVILATMFQFTWLARKGQTDMPLVACIVGAHLFLLRALREGRSALWMIGYGCVALGAMVKGLAGVVLPLGTVGVWALLEGRAREFLRPGPLLAAAGAALAVLGYYAALGPDFAGTFLFEDHLRRFTDGVDVRRPWWWPAVLLVYVALPYTGWLPFAAAAAAGRWPREGRQWSPALLPACWFGLWLLLISASQGKQEHYLVPLLPPLAILMAAGVSRMITPVAGWWTRVGIATAPATVAAGALGYLAYLFRKELLGPWPAAAFAGLALVAGVATWAVFRGSAKRAVAAAVTTAALTWLVAVGAGLAPLERARAAPALAGAATLRQAVGAEPIVAYGPAYTPTPRVTFYLKLARPLRRLETAEELETFLRADRVSFLLLQRSDWEAVEGTRPLGRQVAARVEVGGASYMLLAPPSRPAPGAAGGRDGGRPAPPGG